MKQFYRHLLHKIFIKSDQKLSFRLCLNISKLAWIFMDWNFWIKKPASTRLSATRAAYAHGQRWTTHQMRVDSVPIIYLFGNLVKRYHVYISNCMPSI